MKEGNFYSTILIIIISFILLIGISIPFLQNEIEIKFAFDSIAYLERATTFSSQEGVNFLFLLDMALNNSFGPVILGYLTSNNPYLIWFFNVVVYFSCSFYIIKTLNLKSYLFHTIIFINTISWISLVSLNKEIFCFISIAALVHYLQKKNIYRFMILILCAYLVRWQLVLFFFVIVFLFSRFMLFKKNRKLHVFLFLIGLSLTLPIYTKDLLVSIEF